MTVVFQLLFSSPADPLFSPGDFPKIRMYLDFLLQRASVPGICKISPSVSANDKAGDVAEAS
jgi:hypothetical protein